MTTTPVSDPIAEARRARHSAELTQWYARWGASFPLAPAVTPPAVSHHPVWNAADEAEAAALITEALPIYYHNTPDSQKISRLVELFRRGRPGSSRPNQRAVYSWSDLVRRLNDPVLWEAARAAGVDVVAGWLGAADQPFAICRDPVGWAWLLNEAARVQPQPLGSHVEGLLRSALSSDVLQPAGTTGSSAHRGAHLNLIVRLCLDHRVPLPVFTRSKGRSVDNAAAVLDAVLAVHAAAQPGTWSRYPQGVDHADPAWSAVAPRAVFENALPVDMLPAAAAWAIQGVPPDSDAPIPSEAVMDRVAARLVRSSSLPSSALTSVAAFDRFVAGVRAMPGLMEALDRGAIGEGPGLPNTPVANRPPPRLWRIALARCSGDTLTRLIKRAVAANFSDACAPPQEELLDHLAHAFKDVLLRTPAVERNALIRHALPLLGPAGPRGLMLLRDGSTAVHAALGASFAVGVVQKIVSAVGAAAFEWKDANGQTAWEMLSAVCQSPSTLARLEREVLNAARKESTRAVRAARKGAPAQRPAPPASTAAPPRRRM